MTSRWQDFLSTALEQLRYHVQKLESAATHMMAACGRYTEDISTNHEQVNESITKVYVEQPRLHRVC